jgi:hypothetical protein
MKAKTAITATACFIFTVLHSFSQAPVKQWDVDFGGDQMKQFAAAQQTTDGDIIIGVIQSLVSVAIKLSKAGERQITGF